MARKTKEQLERDEQIYQLTTLVAGEFSLQEVLDKLAEAAVKIVGVKACSIRLLDEESGDLKMRSTYGLSEGYRNKGLVLKELHPGVTLDQVKEKTGCEFRSAL